MDRYHFHYQLKGMDGQWQVLPAEGNAGMLRILLVASLIDPAVAGLLVVLVVTVAV